MSETKKSNLTQCYALNSSLLSIKKSVYGNTMRQIQFTLLISTSEFPMTFAQRDGDGVKLWSCKNSSTILWWNWVVSTLRWPHKLSAITWYLGRKRVYKFETNIQSRFTSIFSYNGAAKELRLGNLTLTANQNSRYLIKDILEWNTTFFSFNLSWFWLAYWET